MGNADERQHFVTQVRKAVRLELSSARRASEDRRHRIDSASSPCGVGDDPAGNTKKIADTFREACTVAEGVPANAWPPKGRICWGGMHSWKRNRELLEQVNRPRTLGFGPTWPIRSCSQLRQRTRGSSAA